MIKDRIYIHMSATFQQFSTFCFKQLVYSTCVFVGQLLNLKINKSTRKKFYYYDMYIRYAQCHPICMHLRVSPVFWPSPWIYHFSSSSHSWPSAWPFWHPLYTSQLLPWPLLPSSLSIPWSFWTNTLWTEVYTAGCTSNTLLMIVYETRALFHSLRANNVSPKEENNEVISWVPSWLTLVWAP